MTVQAWGAAGQAIEKKKGSGRGPIPLRAISDSSNGISDCEIRSRVLQLRQNGQRYNRR